MWDLDSDLEILQVESESSWYAVLKSKQLCDTKVINIKICSGADA